MITDKLFMIMNWIGDELSLMNYWWLWIGWVMKYFDELLMIVDWIGDELFWWIVDDYGLDSWWFITDNTIHMLFVINNDQSRWLLFMIVICLFVIYLWFIDDCYLFMIYLWYYPHAIWWLLFMIVPPGMGDQYWLPDGCQQWSAGA